MKQKVLSLKWMIAVLIAIGIFASVLLGGVNAVSAFAAEVDYSAEARAKDFMTTIYSAKKITYNNVDTLYSVNLYDDEECVIAQASIFNRDGEIDYAVYNYITETIDEYGFNDESILNDFSIDEKIYYAGACNYYNENENNVITDKFGEEVYKPVLNNVIKEFKSKLLSRKAKLNGNSGKPDSGYDGIINWKDIKDRTSGWTNSDWHYLKGITFGSTTDTNGISGSGLSFSSMTSLNKGGTITNHCGPTAITNIMVYYNWLGMDTLLNNDRQDTFDRLRVLCKHDTKGTTYMSDARTAITTYLKERGYNASLTNFNNDFSKYKTALDDEKIILTLLNVKESGGNDWGHFVVTLGYEEFKQSYQKKVLWWYQTKYNYMRYIRVCDGWSTRNQNRFVDLNNFFDSYTNSAITIK